jgi:hypothetical protein
MTPRLLSWKENTLKLSEKRTPGHHTTGLLDGAGGAFSEAFSGFPYSRVRLLVPPSRLFHDHSSGF